MHTLTLAPRNFRLLRYFSLISLLGLVAVTLLLTWGYRHVVTRSLVEQVGRSNANLALNFGSSMWPRYRQFVMDGARKTGSTPDLETLRELSNHIAQCLYKLNIAKVKIYAPDGTVVYATDPAQIGENQSANPHVSKALAGQLSSAMQTEERFESHDAVLSDREIVESYVPMRSVADGPVEGVFELYADVTDLIELQRIASMQVTAMLVATLALFFAFLYVTVRRADRLIAEHDDERNEHQAAIQHRAYHDPLTGLLNRAAFTERIDRALASHTVLKTAVMFLDLDRFKQVNDTRGHAVGDQLLERVAQRTRACLRQGDEIFRMGGDEFTVILPEFGTVDDLAGIAKRLIDEVSAPFSIDGHEVKIGASIGIAIYPNDADNKETLLQHADAALYEAKDMGRGVAVFYSCCVGRPNHEQAKLEAELRRAVAHEEFDLHYQPRIGVETATVVAVEALLRWKHPQLGLLAASDFIGRLELMDLMPEVGNWILREACRQHAQWLRGGSGPLRISVNVSPVQLNSAFVDIVRETIREFDIPAQLVELELTESILVRDVESAKLTIKALREIGVRVAIDDFGMGFASIQYLREFDVDCLKIDRSLVKDLVESARDRSLLASVVRLALSLGLEVVAEGVENEMQASFLADILCTELQGYLFSRPVPPEQIQPLLKQVKPYERDIQLSTTY